MPDDIVNVIASWAGASLCGIAADDLVPFCLLEVPDGASEEACCDEIEQTCRNNKEQLELRRGATPKTALALFRSEAKERDSLVEDVAA